MVIINSMPVKITYFVHGTTTDNEKDLATGWSQGQLSELGIEQAKDLGKIVSDRKFDVVFCSDLKRAIDSANYCFSDRFTIIQDKRLREADYGDYTEKSAKQFKSNMNDFVDKPFPNGESYKDVENRIKDFVDYLKENFDHKYIAIVAHQAPQLALDVLLRDRTWEQAIEEDWRNTKAWQVGWEYEIK